MADDAFDTVETNRPLDDAAARAADETVVLEIPSWLGSIDDAIPESEPDGLVQAEPAWFDAGDDDHADDRADRDDRQDREDDPDRDDQQDRDDHHDDAPIAFGDPIAADDRRTLPAPSGWSDPATGNDGPIYWDRILASEHARVRRYKHPATVVLVEVDGIEQVAATWGRDAAMRILTGIGRALAREARSSDSSARIEPSRFGVLLTETDEIAAINFVERARVACEARLESTDGLRIGIGWASLGAPDLGESLETATARLDADLPNPT